MLAGMSISAILLNLYRYHHTLEFIESQKALFRNCAQQSLPVILKTKHKIMAHRDLTRNQSQKGFQNCEIPNIQFFLDLAGNEYKDLHEQH